MSIIDVHPDTQIIHTLFTWDIISVEANGMSGLVRYIVYRFICRINFSFTFFLHYLFAGITVNADN